MKITQGYGKRVKMARADISATQVGLAKAALSDGASAKNIGRIEKEEVTPRASTLEKIAAATGVDLNWLVTGRTQYRQNCVVRTPGIGARIAKVRIAQGMTLRALAEKSGLGQSSRNVSRLETGEMRPRAETLGRISVALGVPRDHLAYGM